MPSPTERGAQLGWLQHDLCIVRTLLNGEAVKWRTVEALANTCLAAMPAHATSPQLDNIWECLGLLASGLQRGEHLKASVDRALGELR